MKDLFGNEHIKKHVNVNIYADEVQSRVCPINNNKWHYIGLIVENYDLPLLEDIIFERFKGNDDKKSPYYNKNNRVVHWSEIKDADTKNICKRWLEYILNPRKSRKNFYSYILGLNDSKLTREEFNTNDEFNSKYNRFFRSAVLYALKTFFPGKGIIVKNIFHEEGQQQNNKYFPWHCIYKLEDVGNVTFNCDNIIFLSKDHKKDKRSNIIQLCDCVLGASTSIIHGIKKSNNSKYREELVDVYLPLLKRLIEAPDNRNSRYAYYKRIMIRFFPKEKSKLGDDKRLKNQFYSKRTLYYCKQRSGQACLFC